MIRPRVQKAVADVFGNLVRSLLVVASILVGLFAIGIISSLHENLLRAMREGYAAVNPANIMLTSTYFGDDLVKRVTRLDGVRQAQGVTATTVRMRKGSGQWVTVELQARRDFNEGEMNQVILEAGRWGAKKGEIVFDHSKLDDLDAGLGDVVTMEVATGETRELTVVGIVQDQTIGAYSYGGGYFLAPLQGYIHADSLAYLSQPDAYNMLYITTQIGDDEDEITRVLGNVRDDMEKNGYLVFNTYGRMSNDHPNKTYVDAMTGTLYLLGFIVVFLSGFLITNTFSALLKQQTVQIGIMKTVGGRTHQLIGVYMMVILLYSAVAFALAVPLGYIGANRLMVFLSGTINIIPPGERLVPQTLVLQAVIALIVPQIAGFVPIFQGTRMAVQAALSGFEGAGAGGKSRKRKLHLRGLPRPLIISMRNVFRRKTRLALTLVTLSLGGAVFIATFNVRSSLEAYIHLLGRYFRSDVNITLEHSYRLDKVMDLITAMPEVEHVEPWLGARGEMITSDGSVGDNFTILGPPSDSTLVEPMVVSGRWIVPGDENAITLSEHFMTRYPELKPGDRLTIKINGDETDWTLVGFFQLAGKSGGMMAYTSYEHLSVVTRQTNRSAAFRVLAADKNLTEAEQSELGKAIEARLRENGVRVAEVEAGAALDSATARGLDTLTTFLLIMSGLTALVGSIGLTGTMSLSVLERIREIGVLRAIGASDGSLFGLVIAEGAAIGLISWVIASIASFPISKAISDVINRAVFDAPSSFTWTLHGFVIWLGVVAALSVVASIMPARSATRLTIREVLAYE